MRRREFITLASGAAIAWPLTARAQQRVPMIGVRRINPKESDCRAVPTLHASGRGEERRNVRYDFVRADMRIEQMPALASELVARKGHAADSNRRIVIIHLGESHPTRA